MTLHRCVADIWWSKTHWRLIHTLAGERCSYITMQFHQVITLLQLFPHFSLKQMSSIWITVPHPHLLIGFFIRFNNQNRQIQLQGYSSHLQGEKEKGSGGWEHREQEINGIVSAGNRAERVNGPSLAALGVRGAAHQRASAQSTVSLLSKPCGCSPLLEQMRRRRGCKAWKQWEIHYIFLPPSAAHNHHN